MNGVSLDGLSIDISYLNQMFSGYFNWDHERSSKKVDFLRGPDGYISDQSHANVRVKDGSGFKTVIGDTRLV